MKPAKIKNLENNLKKISKSLNEQLRRKRKKQKKNLLNKKPTPLNQKQYKHNLTKSSQSKYLNKLIIEMSI